MTDKNITIPRLLTPCIISLLLSFFSYPVVHAAHSPERIVSLAPSLTQNLILLGADQRLAGVTTYCPNKNNIPVVGTVLEPNIEKILTLKPDLVLATKNGNNKQSAEKLLSLGVNVVTIDGESSYRDIERNFQTLAALTATQARANEILSGIRKRIDQLQLKDRNRTRLTVFVEIGTRPLFTIGRQSFFNEMLQLAGARNIFDDIAINYARISPEAVLSRDPDVILILTMGDVTPEEKDYWYSFKHSKAARTQRIYVMDANELASPTPISFIDGAERIEHRLWSTDSHVEK